MHAAPIVLLLSLWLGAACAAQERLTVEGLPPQAPLVVTATRDGLSLDVAVDLQRGWHLYGRDVGGGQPVAVEVQGGAFAAAGALVTPMDDDGLITGQATLRLPLRRVAAGAALHARMRLMVCDALECLPPITLELRAVEPLRVLLVAVDQGDRTSRIAEFLGARGLAPTVTTYADVTAAQCDAHDVVLADSPTFMQARATTARAGSFPATRSPVVAVGFLGTRLLAARKVTMACGYV